MELQTALEEKGCAVDWCVSRDLVVVRMRSRAIFCSRGFGGKRRQRPGAYRGQMAPRTRSKFGAPVF